MNETKPRKRTRRRKVRKYQSVQPVVARPREQFFFDDTCRALGISRDGLMRLRKRGLLVGREVFGDVSFSIDELREVCILSGISTHVLDATQA